MKVAICNPDEEQMNQLKQMVNAFSKENHIDFETFLFNNSYNVISSKIKYDIAVIDTGMKEIDGVTLARVLNRTTPYIKLIIISSQSKYLDDAFDLGAVRFFKRPFSKSRFFSGLAETVKRIDNETVKFDIKGNSEIIRIEKKDIIFIEIQGRKTKVITPSKVYTTNKTMKYWKEHLDVPRFSVPHHSYLVNSDYITEYKRNHYVVLNDTYVISIARAKAVNFHYMVSQSQLSR